MLGLISLVFRLRQTDDDNVEGNIIHHPRQCWREIGDERHVLNSQKYENSAPDLADKSSKKVDDIISTMSQSSVSAACTSADATITNLAATAAHFRNPDGLRQDIPSAFLSPLPPYLRSAV